MADHEAQRQSARRADQSRVRFRTGLRPGDLGLVAMLHGEGYKGEPGWLSGLAFEGYVLQSLAEFALDNQGRGELFFAEIDRRPVGCAAMVERGDRGQLRWVVVTPEARGLGVGAALVDKALEHARAQGWREVYLETTDGLDASMDIYRKRGFQIVSQTRAEDWEGDRTFILMSLSLA